MRRIPTIEELHSEEYEQLANLRHADLVDFAAQYFFKRKSWFTRLHHVASLLTLAALVYATWATQPGVDRWLTQFGLGVVAFLFVLLPLHEALHALGYRLAGARHLRWNWTRRGLAVYVLAHRDVVAARPFVFVAMLPFLAINAALIAATLWEPRHAVALLSMLLLHIGGSAGDWALLNFLLANRRRDVYTYDDADAGETFFFASRSGTLPAHAGLPASVGEASLAIRLLVAGVWALPAASAAAGAFFIATHGLSARLLAAMLLMSFALIAAVGATFVLVPRSEFGDWLDLALPALRHRWTACTVALTLFVASTLLLGAESCGSWTSLRR